MPSPFSKKDIADFDAVKLTVASSDRILEWSHGEVTKPETINYRTQKPERDGLFCERIFGPVKDINPNDPKYRGIRNREVARDERGEIVTKSIVRRERMGHISLAAPAAHIWFLRGTPSAIGLLLNTTVKNLEKVVYFASYIITKVDEEAVAKALKDLEAGAEAAKEAIKARFDKEAEKEGADIKKLAEERTKELEENLEKYTSTKAKLESFRVGHLISENEYRDLDEAHSDLIEVQMGAQGIKELLDDIDLDKLIKKLHKEAEDAKGQRRKKLVKRLKVLEGMHRASIEPSSMIITEVPVIPPDLRPMVQLTGGRFATSDLNDLYRRVINRNNRLKKLIDLKAPEVIRRNEQRMLQEAVDALIDNSNARSGRAVAASGGRRRLKSLSDMLKGKQGRFRQNLLGKRVDYSGRSVIVAGPELKIDQCGLPKMMALELFKPFVIGSLIEKDLAHNIKAATRMIEANESAVWDTLDEVIENKYVLLNRAPTLHRLGIQAFKPKLIEGKAVQLHPLVCKGFNADFDGDQMAVHVPLSKNAQKEAKRLMSAEHNILKPADGSPVLHIEQDIVLGCYYLTYKRPSIESKAEPFSTFDEALAAYDKNLLHLQSPVIVPYKGEKRETTLGRLIYNEVFPADFPFQNEPTSKKVLQETMAQVFEKYGEEVTARIADELKDVGFRYATVSGLSTGMDDYNDLKNLQELLDKGEARATEISEQYQQGLITDEERYRLTVAAWREVDSQILEDLQKQFSEEDSSTSVIVLSGARGNIGQLKQVTGSMGIMTDATGREIELPIRSNYKDGFTPLEYFTSTRGTRKGMISTALKTADSGYLTRRLVDVAQDVFTTDEKADDPGLLIRADESSERGISFKHRIAGRVLAKDAKKGNKTVAKAGTIITSEVADEIIKQEVEEVRIKSVLTVQSVRGVPKESYGVDLATGEMVKSHEPIGVIAAQSIGEPGTQLTLDTFHSGGVAGDDISQGLPRVEELFEARNPKGEAFVSEIDGEVTIREDGKQFVVQVVPEKTKSKKVKINGYKPSVKNGSKVVKGDVLATKNGKDIKSPAEGSVQVYKDEIEIFSGDIAVARYNIPAFKSLIVKTGDKVKKGDRLTKGSLNLHDIMKYKGTEEAQRYIMGEIQTIFASQGQAIADKHLEVVIRQMFSRVHIDDPGDSPFVIGDIVSKATVIEENDQLTKSGKEPAKYTQLLLGITKVATWSDSFLSAASFQDTTRVLISAAVNGKIDRLYGLKENVIIGRLIPVGTGIRSEDALVVEE